MTYLDKVRFEGIDKNCAYLFWETAGNFSFSVFLLKFMIVNYQLS